MSFSNEPKHTEGHSTEITQTPNCEFMCPEYGRTFEVKDAAKQHLHLMHIKHLKAEHGEFHREV